MNSKTFDEHELGRLKRLYLEELEARRLGRPAGDVQPAAAAAAGEAKLFTDGPIGQAYAESASTSGPVDPSRYERQVSHSRGRPAVWSARPSTRNVRFARALFDFRASQTGEISVRHGDLLQLLATLDHNWAYVEDSLSGLRGLVPLAYLDYSVGCAVAKRDVRPQLGAQFHLAPLAMNKGEPITLLRRLTRGAGCYEASNTRQVHGLAWLQDLDIIKQPVLSDCDQFGRLVKLF